MIRNFLAGLLWGGVVAGLGLGVISQVAGGRKHAPEPVAATPPAVVASAEPAAGADAATPAGTLPGNSPATDAAAKPTPPVAAPAPTADVEPPSPVAAPAAPTVTAVAEPPPPAPSREAERAPQLPAATAELADPSPAEPSVTRSDTALEVRELPPLVASSLPVELPVTAADPAPKPPQPDAHTGALILPDAPVLAVPLATGASTAPTQVQLAPQTAAPRPEVAADAPDLPSTSDGAALAGAGPVPKAEMVFSAPIPKGPALPAGADPAPARTEPPPPPAPDLAEALLKPPVTEEPPDPATIAPEVISPDEPKKPVIITEAKPGTTTFLPDTGLNEPVEGVTTGRLPSIGGAAQPETAPTQERPAPATPLETFARPFDDASGKPTFAVILIDTGATDVDRAQLAALPFPISFAVDPLSPGADAAATIYRAAGQEVLMLATGIPDGAEASDLEQTFQSHAAALPEAVAVLDLAEGGFQNDRAEATQMIPILKSQGRGLVTYDQGLNAADQVARRDGLPAAVIFRSLDAAEEATPVIRRYLDRAAFKAAQESSVVVIGHTRPETVAALLEWTVEGRASSVVLAPVSAVLSRN